MKAFEITSIVALIIVCLAVQVFAHDAGGQSTETDRDGGFGAPAATPRGQAASEQCVLSPLACIHQADRTKGEDDEARNLIVGVTSALAWPIAVLIALCWLSKSPVVEAVLLRLPHRVTQLSVAGLEIKLSQGANATLEEMQTLIAQIPKVHQEWLEKSHIDAEFHLVVDDIKNYLCTDRLDFATALTPDDVRKFRFTIHVHDVILTHTIRQLTDYAGHDKGGSGRIFSIRRGIVGLAWRLEKSTFENHAFDDEALVKKWGMTRVEAHDTTKKKEVLLVFLLKNDAGLPVGSIYADADSSKLFDATRLNNKTPQDAFAIIEGKIAGFSKRRGLVASLEKLESARVKVKSVDIYKASRS